MEKIKITVEQEVALKTYAKEDRGLDFFIEEVGSFNYEYKPLNKFSNDEFARLLYQPDSYEVEVKYAVGDWVLMTTENEHKGHVCEIRAISARLANLDYGNGFASWWNYIDFRHATPEEIKEEQERRLWKSIGRGYRELKVGDKYIAFGGTNRTIDGESSKRMCIECIKSGKINKFYPIESAISFGGDSE